MELVRESESVKVDVCALGNKCKFFKFILNYKNYILFFSSQFHMYTQL